MDYEKILAQLRGERDLLEKAIVNIENLARKGKRGRGRPPGSFTKITHDATMKAASE